MSEMIWSVRLPAVNIAIASSRSASLMATASAVGAAFARSASCSVANSAWPISVAMMATGTLNSSAQQATKPPRWRDEYRSMVSRWKRPVRVSVTMTLARKTSYPLERDAPRMRQERASFSIRTSPGSVGRSGQIHVAVSGDSISASETASASRPTPVAPGSSSATVTLAFSMWEMPLGPGWEALMALDDDLRASASRPGRLDKGRELTVTGDATRPENAETRDESDLDLVTRTRRLVAERIASRSA